MNTPLPPYTLKRTSRRRSMALVVLPDGSLEVRVPKRVSVQVVEDFIRERADWIARKAAERTAWPQLPPRTWQAGDVFYLHGTPHELVLDTHHRVQVAPQADGTLLLAQQDPTNPARVRQNLLKWYQAEGQRHFAPQLEDIAFRMAEAPPRLLLTNARQRWGSCQAQSRTIRLSVRLLMAPTAVQNYVLVHELSHLQHMDHSPQFWQRVADYCPDWRAHEKHLREHANLWRFD